MVIDFDTIKIHSTLPDSKYLAPFFEESYEHKKAPHFVGGQDVKQPSA